MAIVVKIDLCRSKIFAGEQERRNPSIRTDALNRMIEVSKASFPRADEPYPQGSFYKADGDALYYIVEKPSVALRGAIEFMQTWCHQGIPQYPECRIYLDRGHIDAIAAPGRTELTGKPFENISVFEKGLDEGKIYLTLDVVESVDQTMAKFRFYRSVVPRKGESLRLYVVDFDDPRTVSDSSLLHALFVAHPVGTEARERLFELFVVEYLLDHGTLDDVALFETWARGKNYPLPPTAQLRGIMTKFSFVELQPAGSYRLRAGAKEEVENAREHFRRARESCTTEVMRSVVDGTGRKSAVEGLVLSDMLEEYLCAVFSEIRMMANYFWATLQLFDAGPEHFARFDYVLRRRLDDERLAYFDEWRRGFLNGLRNVSAEGNLYIAAVFHNVLATYYLNRAGQTSPYQIDKLKQRDIFLDTNIFYSLLVPASSYHEVTQYFMQRLTKMGILARILLVTLAEYEEHLAFVERNTDARGQPSALLVRKNPWLWQEYKKNPARYLQRFGVCRQMFSVAHELVVEEENYTELSERLKVKGVQLEKHMIELSEEEVEALWSKLRNAMTSDWWDLEKYWDFILREHPQQVRRHDMMCVVNVEKKANARGMDELGPKVMLVTADKKLWRLRRLYPFIVSPESFLEFILPYLFLSDIPVTDAERFPNQLLRAQLGTLLVSRPPELAEIVGAYFKDPALGL